MLGTWPNSTNCPHCLPGIIEKLPIQMRELGLVQSANELAVATTFWKEAEMGLMAPARMVADNDELASLACM